MRDWTVWQLTPSINRRTTDARGNTAQDALRKQAENFPDFYHDRKGERFFVEPQGLDTHGAALLQLDHEPPPPPPARSPWKIKVVSCS